MEIALRTRGSRLRLACSPNLTLAVIHRKNLTMTKNTLVAIIVGLASLIIGYFAGREHVKYELRSSVSEVGKIFSEGLQETFVGDSDRVTARISACDTNVELLNSQIELYYVIHNSWPASLGTITKDVTFFPDGELVCPFGTAYVYNTTTHRISEHDHSKQTEAN